MKNRLCVISLIAVMAAFSLVGCGTTVDETLGAPPEQNVKDSTAYIMPGSVYHEKEGTDIVVKGLAGCVEPGILVMVTNTETKLLGKTLANSEGSFEVKIETPDEIINGRVLVQAQHKDELPSNAVSLLINPFAAL